MTRAAVGILLGLFAALLGCTGTIGTRLGADDGGAGDAAVAPGSEGGAPPDGAVAPTDAAPASDAARPDGAAPAPDGSPPADTAPGDTSPPPADGPPPPPGWQLVWAEEFDVPGLPDPATWVYEVGYVRNGEEQYYTEGRSENARVENGLLVIEGRKDNWNGHAITAASITTQGQQDFLYGRIEVRAKLPTGKGPWPAIWLLGTNITSVGWPTCGEVDIMENVGFQPTTIFGTVHTAAHNWSNGGARGGQLDVTAPWEGFYTYAVEWFADRIDFYVDDQMYFSYVPDGVDGSWPFDQPVYLLLNLAIGGSWGGQQGVDDSIFPALYYVDYVRYYQRT
jgi:beta-glucanase (GH16 family)